MGWRHCSNENRGTVSNTQLTKAIYEFSKESLVLKVSEDRQCKIIKTMYGKIDINEPVKSLKHLTKEQQAKLASVLEAYPDMYEGAIGMLNIKAVHFELKPGSKPYHAKSFPIPKAYENPTKEECKRFSRTQYGTTL